MTEEKYEIVNVLNHNTVLCKTQSTHETYVFFGKGIGFQKKGGDIFYYDDSVENALLVLEFKEANEYKELIERVENKVLVKVVGEVVQEADRFFNHKLNGNLHITLLDHLNFAIDRQRQNYQMNCPFFHELKFIYPKEYEFSKSALAYINEQMKGIICFDEAELGFLVLHIHAAISNERVSKVLFNNQILYECIQIVDDALGVTLDRHSFYYTRFIKHLEYAIHRYRIGTELQNVLLESIREICAKEFSIAMKIHAHLKRKHRISFDENEVGYLALHIYYLQNRD